jgi:hypothetical protein
MALWEQLSVSRQYVARHGLTSAQYQAEFDANLAAGYQLDTISGCWDGGWIYAAIWSKPSIAISSLPFSQRAVLQQRSFIKSG